MNQILVTEKLYITPEIKRKKFIYKIEFFLSVFLVCLLFSYYIYAEYDRNKTEQVSQEILAQLKYEESDDTIKKANDDTIVVILEDKEAQKQKEEIAKKLQVDTATYKSAEGIEYTTEAVLEIPTIQLKYPVLSETSPDLLFVSLNYFHGPEPNEVGNYCIVGHYYQSGKMFGNLHKLKNGDIAKLTDLSGRTIEYEVYDKFVVKPTDTSCTSQLTDGRKELTLITCTNHGKERLVVKLREVR